MMNKSIHQSLLAALETRSNEREDSPIVSWYWMVSLAIVVPAFLMNSSLCVLHACCKRVRRLSNIFLITHCVANTFQTLATMILFSWGEHTDVFLCIINVSFSCSVLCIPVISTLTLFKSQWAHRYVICATGSLSYVILITVLCAGVGVAIPPFLGWGSPLLFYKSPTTVSPSYSIFAGFVLTVIPLVIICGTNYKIFSRVRSYEQRARRDTEPNCSRAGKAQVEPRRRDGEAKLVIIMQVFVFAVCLVPVTVESLSASFLSLATSKVIKYSLNCFAQAYCALSPVLYGYTNKDIRRSFNCSCYQKKFVLQNPRKKSRQRQLGGGSYRGVGLYADPFVLIQQVQNSCDELSVDNYLNGGGRERFVHFAGLSTNISISVEIDNVSRPQKVAEPKKRPITTEVSPIRRHSTLRKQEDAPKVKKRVHESVTVSFDSKPECTEKQRKKYLATPSVKRMRLIKKSLSNISDSDLQSGIVSFTGSEFESLQHMAPHFTNYSDPMRSAGFRQVLTRRGKLKRTCSLHRRDKREPKIRGFMERRCSLEGDRAIRIASQKPG